MAATDELRRRLDDNDATFADRVAAIIRDQAGAGPSGVPVLSASGQSGGTDARNMGNPGGPSMSYAACAGMPARPVRMSKEDVYWQCRRSLRIWPIGDGDVRKGLRDFLKDRFRLSSSFLSDMGEISVERITARPRSKIVGEVVAIFSSVDVRDAACLRGADDNRNDDKLRTEIGPDRVLPSPQLHGGKGPRGHGVYSRRYL